MTGLDNGPEDGDFVRYIDALLATRAAALPQPTREFDQASRVAASDRPRFGPPASATPQRNPPIVASPTPSFMVPNAASRRDEASLQRTSRAQGATLTPAQAAAVAAAMIRNGEPVHAKTWVSLAALLLGAASLVYGWFGARGAPFVFIGFALAYWAIKRIAGDSWPGLARGTSIRKP
jgi:hypothetical protein